MRTKFVLGAAILAAGLASSMAQNVYSLNVVGYVNQTVQAGKWYMWANPLSNGNNTTTNVMIGMTATTGGLDAWDGAEIFTFGTAGYSSGADTFVGSGVDIWVAADPSGNYMNLAPGQGWFFYAPTAGTVTFVGDVVTTNSFSFPANAFSLVGSAFPATNNLVAIGLTGGPGNPGLGTFDTVFRYDPIAGYNSGDSYVPGTGWVGTGPTLNGPVINVGEAIFYQNAGATVGNYVQTFTIQ